MKLKNPVKLFKEPVKTIDEVEQRKKDIKPWFIISGVLCLVGIGVFGLMIFGFLYIMANRIKKKIECLTCDNCNKTASFQNIEEFEKYVTYTIVGGKAKYKGAKHTVINQGIDAIVEAQADASAIVYISLTCPHCGTTKQLEYYITPFICSKREEKVSIRDVDVLKSRFERLVKEVVEVFNDPLRHHEIPYTIHSVNHPNYEERGKLQLDSSKVYGYYNGVKIEYHIDVEELVEGFFVHNEINGKIIESNNKAKSKKNKKALTQENEVKEESLKLDEECEEVQNPQNNVQTNEKQKSNLVIGSDHIEVSLDDRNEQINQSENKNEHIVDENLGVNKESEPEKNSKIIENLEVLKKLKELLDLDIITKDEFIAKKKELLDIKSDNETNKKDLYIRIFSRASDVLNIISFVVFLIGIIFLLLCTRIRDYNNGFFYSYVSSITNGNVTSLWMGVFTICTVIILSIYMIFKSSKINNINHLLITSIIRFAFYVPTAVLSFILFSEDYLYGTLIFAILSSCSCFFSALDTLSLIIIKKIKNNSQLEKQKRRSFWTIFAVLLLIVSFGGSMMKELVIPEKEFEFTVVYEGDQLFYYLDEYIGKNEVVVIPSTYNGHQVKGISRSAFYGVYGLTSVTISSSVCTIGQQAFANCTSLTNIVIPDSVTSIGQQAFEDCTALTNIVIPDSVTSIGIGAFENCTSLTNIVIPKSVTSIEYSTFANCYNLIVYCELESQPDEWSYDWNNLNRPVYWAGQWEYDVNGNPVPLS